MRKKNFAALKEEVNQGATVVLLFIPPGSSFSCMMETRKQHASILEIARICRISQMELRLIPDPQRASAGLQNQWMESEAMIFIYWTHTIASLLTWTHLIMAFWLIPSFLVSKAHSPRDVFFQGTTSPIFYRVFITLYN